MRSAVVSNSGSSSHRAAPTAAAGVKDVGKDKGGSRGMPGVWPHHGCCTLEDELRTHRFPGGLLALAVSLLYFGVQGNDTIRRNAENLGEQWLFAEQADVSRSCVHIGTQHNVRLNLDHTTHGP